MAQYDNIFPVWNSRMVGRYTIICICRLISDKTGFDKAVMGFIFLSLATQLPEIVTNSTAAIGGNESLVLNSMFGGITMQTAVLAISEYTILGTVLTYAATKSVNMLQGSILMLMLSILLGIVFLGDVQLLANIGVAPL